MSRVSPRAAALFLVASAAVVGAGCAPIERRPAVPAARVAHYPRCDEASGEATMGSVSAARYFARVNLGQNLGASRGFLASQGARQVRVVGRDVQCRPYELGVGLTRCVAVARLCGR